MHILMLLLWTSTGHFFLYSSTGSLHEPSDLKISQTPHPTYLIFLNLPYPPLSTRFQSIIWLSLSFMPPVIYVVSRVCRPPYKLTHSRNPQGSVRATKLLQSLQGRTARTITGGLRDTTYDVFEVHAFIPPIDLIFCKAQINAATRICALPPAHPLFLIACQAAHCFINHHKSPLHYLFFTTQLNLQPFETITPSRRHPCYIPLFSTKVSHSKETALNLMNKSHHMLHYKVYCDGSSYEGGVGAAAVLYKNNHILKSIWYKLGTPEEHTVYKVELVGIILALHLLMSLACQLVTRH